MSDSNQFQVLVNLVDEIELSIGEIEKAYQNNDGERFKKAKEQILDIQNKISKTI